MTGYVAPWWLPGGHAQTLWAALRRPPRVALRRERWETPDGDFIDLDWAGDARAARLLALFHGLEGSSDSHYARSLAAHAVARGWCMVVPHFRGCSGEANRLPRAYHSGDSDEIDWVLRRLRDAHPAAEMFAAGVSLGGNALLKWLGEQGDAAAGVVRRAAAVSAPIDLAAAGRALGHGFNRHVYARAFLATLKPRALAKLDRFPGFAEARRIRDARTLYEFDNVVTAPLHGFRDTDDYWTRASSAPWLARVSVPTLVLNARNDPFLPAAALERVAQGIDPTYEQERGTKVVLEFPLTGGHAGFVTGPFPGRHDWLPRRLLDFLGSTS